MNRRHFIMALASCLSAALSILAGTSCAISNPLILGVFPRRNIKTTRSFSDFWLAIKQQKYDLVQFNQYHHIVSHQTYGYDVILNNKELGRSTIAGSLIVRKDCDRFRGTICR